MVGWLIIYPSHLGAATNYCRALAYDPASAWDAAYKWRCVLLSHYRCAVLAIALFVSA